MPPPRRRDIEILPGADIVHSLRPRQHDRVTRKPRPLQRPCHRIPRHSTSQIDRRVQAGRERQRYRRPDKGSTHGDRDRARWSVRQRPTPTHLARVLNQREGQQLRDSASLRPMCQRRSLSGPRTRFAPGRHASTMTTIIHRFIRTSLEWELPAQQLSRGRLTVDGQIEAKLLSGSVQEVASPGTCSRTIFAIAG